MLTKEQILGSKDRKTETVPVPEWGGDVTIMEMSGAQRDALDGLMASRYDHKNGRMLSTKDLRAKMVILSVVNQDGTPMFSDKDMKDIGEKSGLVLDRLVVAINKLNGLDDDAKEETSGN